MSAEPSSAPRSLQEILDQLPSQNRTALDATREQLAEFPGQGKEVTAEQAGQLPVSSTPQQAAKDLVHKYSQETTPSVDRTPAIEPER